MDVGRLGLVRIVLADEEGLDGVVVRVVGVGDEQVAVVVVAQLLDGTDHLGNGVQAAVAGVDNLHVLGDVALGSHHAEEVLNDLVVLGNIVDHVVGLVALLGLSGGIIAIRPGPVVAEVIEGGTLQQRTEGRTVIRVSHNSIHIVGINVVILDQIEAVPLAGGVGLLQLGIGLFDQVAVHIVQLIGQAVGAVVIIALVVVVHLRAVHFHVLNQHGGNHLLVAGQVSKDLLNADVLHAGHLVVGEAGGVLDAGEGAYIDIIGASVLVVVLAVNIEVHSAVVLIQDVAGAIGRLTSSRSASSGIVNRVVVLHEGGVTLDQTDIVLGSVDTFLGVISTGNLNVVVVLDLDVPDTQSAGVHILAVILVGSSSIALNLSLLS